jgi:hypothetical protein
MLLFSTSNPPLIKSAYLVLNYTQSLEGCLSALWVTIKALYIPVGSDMLYRSLSHWAILSYCLHITLSSFKHARILHSNHSIPYKENSIKVMNSLPLTCDPILCTYSLINWLLRRNVGPRREALFCRRLWDAQDTKKIFHQRVILQGCCMNLATSSNNTVRWKPNQLTMNRMADTMLVMMVRRRCASS